MTMIYIPLVRETIPTLTTAVGLTAANITSNVVHAIIQAVGGNVRYTLDGTTKPVAAKTGHRLLTDAVIDLWGDTALRNFLAINDGGTATLEVTYYGKGV